MRTSLWLPASTEDPDQERITAHFIQRHLASGAGNSQLLESIAGFQFSVSQKHESFRPGDHTLTTSWVCHLYLCVTGAHVAQRPGLKDKSTEVQRGIGLAQGHTASQIRIRETEFPDLQA